LESQKHKKKDHAAPACASPIATQLMVKRKGRLFVLEAYQAEQVGAVVAIVDAGVQQKSSLEHRLQLLLPAVAKPRCTAPR